MIRRWLRCIVIFGALCVPCALAAQTGCHNDRKIIDRHEQALHEEDE